MPDDISNSLPWRHFKGSNMASNSLDQFRYYTLLPSQEVPAVEYMDYCEDPEEDLAMALLEAHRDITVGWHLPGSWIGPLQVSVGSGGALAVLAATVASWVKQRRSDIVLKITDRDENTVEIKISHVKEPDRIAREVMEAFQRLSDRRD